MSVVSLDPAAQSQPVLAGRQPPRRLIGNDSYTGPIAIGLLVVAVTFGGLGAWSTMAPISAAAIAPGSLVVDSNRKSIQHLEGGIIREIHVRDGDRVEEGQVLVRLDETQMQANLKLLEGRYGAARALEARLLAEREGRERLSFSEDLQALGRRDAEFADIMAGQLKIFEARRASLAGQITILQNRIEQSKAQIGGLQQQDGAKWRQIQLFNSELEGLRQLHEKGIASGKQLSTLERDVARMIGERGEVQARMSEVRQAIGEANLQILQVQKSFTENVSTELREAQAQVFEALERINVIKDGFSRLTVRAPVSGTVVDLAVHTVGGVVPPASRLLDIVPGNDELVVEARVSPADIDGVHEGLTADVRFTGIRRGTTPVATGTVSRVSADRLVNPRTEQAYYIVRLNVNEGERAKLAEYRLVPGLPVETIINKGERTMFEYFAQPFKDAMARAFRQ